MPTGVYQRKTRQYTEEDVKDIIDFYNDGVSIAEIAEVYSHCTESISKLLKSNNIEVKIKRGLRKYNFNEQYFDEIDTEEKAYWLGFISADGGITERVLQIGLQARDRPHLEKLCVALGDNFLIRDEVIQRKSGEFRYSRLCVYSRYLSQSLQNKGVTPRKSYTIKPYAELDPKLYRHYWRGVIDGDGCIYIDKDNRPRIELCGTWDVVEQFVLWGKTLCESKSNVCKNINIWRCKFTGISAIKIIRELYKDANIFLDRKMEIARTIYNLPIKIIPSTINCTYCLSTNTKIDGTSRGKQRYYCYYCDKHYLALSDYTNYGLSKLPINQFWMEF
jgi:hypothetical protein